MLSRGLPGRGAAVTPEPSPQGTRARRWLARLSFVLAGLAVVIVAVFAGLKSLPMLAVGLAGAVVSLAAAYFFLSRRGVWRWVALAVFVLAPVAVIVIYAFRDLLWVAVVAAAAWLGAGVTARLALAGDVADWRMPEHPAQPPARHPVRHRERRPAPLGTSRRSARGGRPQLAQRADHTPRAAHVLDRGAQPAPGRHQSRGGPHRMTSHEVSAWSVTLGLPSEGPRWHKERQELLWVDILGRQMHRER